MTEDIERVIGLEPETREPFNSLARFSIKSKQNCKRGAGTKTPEELEQALLESSTNAPIVVTGLRDKKEFKRDKISLTPSAKAEAEEKSTSPPSAEINIRRSIPRPKVASPTAA